MGLVEFSLVSEEPPYWGWLKPLLLEDLDGAINSANPDYTETVSGVREPVNISLHRLRGALQFTQAPDLLDRFSSALENGADLETLLSLREETLTVGGALSRETAEAVGQALQEEILAVSASLEATSASKDESSSTLLQMAASLEERQTAMEFLGLHRSSKLIASAVERLRKLSSKASLDREDLLQSLEPLAQLQASLADALFYGETFLGKWASPSAAREILTAISLPLQDEIAALRHLLLETTAQDNQGHLKPGLEKMAGVFRMLGHEDASVRLTSLAHALDLQSSSQDIALALAQAEVLVLGLLTRYPGQIQWQADNLKQTTALPTDQEPDTNPTWEQARLMIERWSRRGQAQDAVAAIRAIGNLDGISDRSQPLADGILGLLETCFSSIQTPGVPEKAAVLQAFGTLQKIRFGNAVSDEQILKNQTKLNTFFKRKPVAVENITRPPLFDWEASLSAETREAFWTFCAAHLGALKRPESEHFWAVLGWMVASVSMLAGSNHPLRMALFDAHQNRHISPDTLTFLEWILKGVKAFRAQGISHLLNIMGIQTAAAQQAISEGDEARAWSFLQEQSKLLSEHGFFTGESP